MRSLADGLEKCEEASDRERKRHLDKKTSGKSFRKSSNHGKFERDRPSTRNIGKNRSNKTAKKQNKLGNMLQAIQVAKELMKM